MKIVDAVWEKRNMGVGCIEIGVETQDTPRELEDALERGEKADYLVVKTPTCRMDLSEVLMKKGFCFVEAMFSLEKELGKPVFVERNREKAARMTYCLGLDKSKERIWHEIQGGMYTTDRVSLDRYFSPKQTADRYIGMLEDELGRGAEVIEYLLEGVPFGFSCFRQISPGKYYQALTGIYEAYRGKGLGFSLAYLLERELRKRNAARLITGVSANNEVSLRVHLKNGFLPVETTYVYVKHFGET